MGRSSGAGVIDLPLASIDWDGADVVAQPPDPRPGAWAGAPTALWHEGTFWLTYRMRRPVGEGRGYANVIARSEDGVRFTTVAEVHRDTFDGDSLERPALVVTPEGRWRLYVSVALPGTKAWRVDLLEAASPEALPAATPRTVLPSTATHAPKDPVIRRAADGSWVLWASVHDLADPAHTDRMATWWATSPDGVSWTWRGTALAGRDGAWDARGVRPATAVPGALAPSWWPEPLGDDEWAVLFDGRASAAENWEERTGLAHGPAGALRHAEVAGGLPLGSPHGSGGLRYLDLVPVPEGAGGPDAPGAHWRVFAEVARADGAHDLRTAVLPR
ncbi:MAG: hypothetical protein U0Q15_09690 [Kineosporiaceae bacterium]